MDVAGHQKGKGMRRLEISATPTDLWEGEEAGN